MLEPTISLPIAAFYLDHVILFDWNFPKSIFSAIFKTVGQTELLLLLLLLLQVATDQIHK